MKCLRVLCWLFIGLPVVVFVAHISNCLSRKGKSEGNIHKSNIVNSSTKILEFSMMRAKESRTRIREI
jgi:hypothetical protein